MRVNMLIEKKRRKEEKEREKASGWMDGAGLSFFSFSFFSSQLSVGLSQKLLLGLKHECLRTIIMKYSFRGSVSG